MINVCTTRRPTYQTSNNECDLKDMDLELTIKSSLKVRTVRGKGTARHHTLARMVLGCDSSLTYSADPIKIEATECTGSPYGYSSSNSPTPMGIFANTRSFISDFCFSSAESKAVAMKKFFEGDLGKDSLTSWTTKHPQNWTKKEVLDWVYYVVEQEKLDGSCVKGEAFSNFTGSSLIEMGKEGFVAADPINGLKLYQTFRNLINNVVIEEPRRAPPYSSLDTFNQENHLDVKRFTRDIINGVYGNHRVSALNNPAPQDVAQGICKQESSVQISSYPSLPQWRHSERARHNSCKHLSLNTTGFDTPGNNSSSCNRNNVDGSNDLIIYEEDGDNKVVGLHGLGAYPIDKDFSPWFSLLPASLSTSNTFTAPISPVTSPSGPQFDFTEHPLHHLSLTPAISTAPPTPPLSHRGSLSSPSSSCPGPSPTWFSPQQTPRLFSPPRNSNSLKRQHSNSCPGGADFKQTIISCSNRPTGVPLAQCSRTVNGIPVSGHSINNPSQEIPSESSSPPSSYHFQKTMTTTLCRQNAAGVGPLRQSHTFSSSWTISSGSSSSPSSSLLEHQDSKYSVPGPSLSSSSSSPSWHDSIASASLEVPSSSYMPNTGDSGPLEDSIFIDEDDLGRDYDTINNTEIKKKTPRRNRNGSSKTGNHLWEFVRDLLRDPKFNPKLLKWEDKENGVFRFVQSEQVARLWGEKKNNPMMTYEKLSRAMRFCRKTGFFNAVPRTGKFPKKLCFMFGEKAHGWKD